MATRQKANRGDISGRAKQKLLEEHAEERKEAEKRMATAEKVRAVEDQQVLDLTKKIPAVVEEPEFEVLDGSPEDDEDVDETIAALAGRDAAAETASVSSPATTTVVKETCKVRARYDLEQVTIGAGTFYDFEEGRKYIVPYNVAFHLAERELVDILD